MELYTVDETARLLRVSPITIRRYISAGQLEAVRVGRGVRVHREAIDSFVKPLPSSTPRSFHRLVGAAGANDDSTSAVNDKLLPTILESLGFSIGIGRSAEPTNIAEHKDEYLADAFESKG